MTRMALVLLIIVAGCDSPSIGMHGIPARKVTVGGSQFSVYSDGRKVEAIRTNTEYSRGIMARGHEAIEKATGCTIVPGTFDGDPALMRAEIACDAVADKTPRHDTRASRCTGPGNGRYCRHDFAVIQSGGRDPPA